MTTRAYRRTLVKAFRTLHGCEAKYLNSVPVVETSQGRTVWEGEVDVFFLSGHPNASRGYAWAYDKARGSEIVVVLELPPVISLKSPVRAASQGLQGE